MTKKSEVQEILDAVAGFSISINSFKGNIINTVKVEIKELEIRLLNHFDKEINRTNSDVKELQNEVDTFKEKANEEKTTIRIIKNKLGWAIAIGVFFSTTIIAVAQYFIFKALE